MKSRMSKDFWKDYYTKENIEFLGDVYREFRKDRASIEAGFAIKALGLHKGEKVLDLCCGRGHNSVYLAKQGFYVVGVDYSSYSIEKARELAADEGVEVIFWQGDAREFSWIEEFHAAVMLFNSFGYFEEDKENLRILERIASALKNGGKFLIEVLSRDFAVAQARKGSDEYKVSNGYDQVVLYQFDPKTSIFRIKRIITRGEIKKEFNLCQRAYTYSELDYLIRGIRLEITEVYGGYEGNPFTVDSPSLILIGYKR